MENDIFELADLDAQINNESNHFKKGKIIRSTFDKWDGEEQEAIDFDRWKHFTNMDKQDAIDKINGDFDDSINWNC